MVDVAAEISAGRLKIELGGGVVALPGYVNLDPVHGDGDWKRVAQDGIPVPDGCVEHIRASHVMEHIPAGAPRLRVFNEAHRVLRPGGVFEVIVPLMTGTWHAVADPTHVSFWVAESFLYFDGTFAANAEYDLRLWTTKAWSVVNGFEGHWEGTPR
jgi:SAM-dependent methyltransferase